MMTFSDLQVSSGIDCSNIGPLLLNFTPDSTKTSDEYYEPWGVAADPEELYVVSDHHNHRIQVSFLPCSEKSAGSFRELY